MQGAILHSCCSPLGLAYSAETGQKQAQEGVRSETAGAHHSKRWSELRMPLESRPLPRRLRMGLYLRGLPFIRGHLQRHLPAISGSAATPSFDAQKVSHEWINNAGPAARLG